MVKACSAFGCSNRSKKRSLEPGTRENDVTFHAFPKDKVLSNRWAAALRRKNFTPTRTTYICSNHFLETDYEYSDFGRRALKRHVVPSVCLPSSEESKFQRRVIKLEVMKSIPTPKPMPVNPLQDHKYSINQTKEERRVRLNNERRESRFHQLRRQVKTSKQKLRRLLSRQQKLRTLLKEAQDRNLMEESAFELMESAFGGMSLALFRHLLKQKDINKHRRTYGQDIRKFAVTLNFLSPAAYDYVRQTLGLPHPVTLRRWHGSVDCSPGFLGQALECASKLAEKSGERMCSLVVDEMSLRTEVVWNPSLHQFTGHVDFGGEPIDNTVASHALVFMIVSLSSRWKTPIAYFFTDHINSSQLSHSIKEALMKTADNGLIVKAIVADGLKANVKAARCLGFNLSAINPTCHISHPHDDFNGEKVWFICDPPHMLKLTRNLLADRHTIYVRQQDGICRPISWKYIQALHDLQSKDNLYLANKLGAKHVNYNNVKMKVNIAAQTLSLSVATAIDHLRDDLHLPAFQGSAPTCEFIRNIDRLFDHLNAKNPFAKGQKAALSLANQDEWQRFFSNVKKYLLTLLDYNRTPLYASQRGQAILGFIISTTSTEGLAMELLGSGKLKYLLPYKYSQDHLEMFFSKIRRRGGWNNNPSPERFRYSMRILLHQNEIKAPSSGNTIQLDDTQEIPVEAQRHTSSTRDADTEFVIQAENLNTVMFTDSEWQMSCLVYTAGFICRRLMKRLKCVNCQAVLQDEMQMEDPRLRFLNRKNRGGLVTPSNAVVEVLRCTEHVFRIVMPDSEKLPHQKKVDILIQQLVVNALRDQINTMFSSDHFNSHEFGVEEPHSMQLVKAITKVYVNMRLWKAGKQHHQRVILGGRSSKRMKLNKYIIFSGL